MSNSPRTCEANVGPQADGCAISWSVESGDSLRRGRPQFCRIHETFVRDTTLIYDARPDRRYDR